MATMNAPPSALNTETTIALSQSMDSVNTTPEEEVSEQCSLRLLCCFILLSVRPCVCLVCPPVSPCVCLTLRGWPAVGIRMSVRKRTE